MNTGYKTSISHIILTKKHIFQHYISPSFNKNTINTHYRLLIRTIMQ